MSWNYRIYKRASPLEGEEPTYEIVEAFYNSDGSLRAITTEGVAPMGDSPDDLEKVLHWMLLAFNKQILEEPVELADWDGKTSGNAYDPE